MAGKIKVPSELVPSQSNKIMLRSKYVHDDVKGHDQEYINNYLENKIEDKVIEAGGVNWDTVPTAGSNNAVKSKDIKAALEKVTGYFVLDSNVLESTVAKTVTVADFPALAIGGSIKIKMLTKNTATNPTLRIGPASATAYPLYYNNERASADNTWEKNEVISVYFDGTNYQASNAQGGSNKKINAYLYGDLRTLAVGQTYDLEESLKTKDKHFLRMTKAVGTMNTTDAVAIGELKVYSAGSAGTYKALRAVNAYNGTDTEGLYAIGRPSIVTVTIDASSLSIEEDTDVEVTIGEVTQTITVPAAASETKDADIAALITAAFTSVPGWTLTDNEDGTLTLRCNIGGANTITVSSNVGETGLSITSSAVNGAATLSKYIEGTWTAVTLADYAADSIESGETANGEMWQKLTLEELTSYTAVQDTLISKFISEELHKSMRNLYVKANTATPVNNSLNLEVGKLYRIVIKLSTTATGAPKGFHLRQVYNQSNPSKQIAIIDVGDDTVDFEYTPLEGSNYQYISAWTSSGAFTYSVYIYEKKQVNKVPKIYDDFGQNDNGSISQKALTEMLHKETLIFDGSIPSTALSATSHPLTTPAGFKVGKKYKIIVTISSSVSKTVNIYLRSISSSSTPAIMFNGVSAPDLSIPAGETTKTCYYIPSAETNYQYFNRYADVSTVVTTNWKVYEVSGWKERCDIIDSVGTDIFDISSESVGYTDSSKLIAEKTESGYNFSCISAGGYKYAFGSLSGLIIGNQYQLTFDYAHDLKVTTQYAGILRLVKNSPLSSTIINQYKSWVLKNYTSPGSITYRFTAESNTAYFKVAANDIGTGGSITLSNIALQNLGKVADIAEMVVEDMVDLDTEMSNASVSGTYYGRKIPSVNASYKFGYSYYMPSGGTNSNRQGCAAYNGYLFEFYAKNAYVNIYNLETKTFHSTVTPTNISTGHCNTACFSTKFYDANDTFPLLYVSGDSNAKIQVYRVTLENDVFTITQVQDITMSLTLPAGSMTWGQAFLDNDKNRLWWFGATGWSSFAIPSIFDGDNNVISAVTLTSSDIKDSFGSSMPGTHLQGGIIVNGILYEVQGVPAWGDTATLNVIDMWGMKDINFINLSSLGWTYEPEGVALYDRHLYVNTQGNGIYIFYIGK